MRIPVTISDRIYVPIQPELRDMIAELRQKFTYKNPEYQKKRAMKFWTGNIPPSIKTWANVIHPDYGDCLSIPRGGTQKLREIAYNFNIELSWIDQRFTLPPIYGYENNVVLWPEQERLVQTMMATENCLIQSPTGSGKTMVLLKIAEIILKISGPVLIVVWEGDERSGLFKQWIDRIGQCFGILPKDVGMINGHKKKIAPLTVAMQQSLKNAGRRYVYSFGGIICDEVQRFAAPTFQKVVDIYPARFRFGASADHTRRDGKEFLIHDVFGKVAGEVEKSALIRRGKIVPVTIRIVPTDFDLQFEATQDDNGNPVMMSWKDLPTESKDFNDLLDAMTSDNERNELIWSFIEPCLKDKRIIIAATARVDHARYWDKRVRKLKYRCGLMIGGSDHSEEFESTKEGLTNRKINFGAGTYQKVSTAQDIPALDRYFATTPIAGNKQLFNQCVGRLTRPEKKKNSAVFYYFWDNPLFPGVPKKLARQFPGCVQMLVDGEFLDQ